MRAGALWLQQDRQRCSQIVTGVQHGINPDAVLRSLLDLAVIAIARQQGVSPRPNAQNVLHQLPSWIAHYNEVLPHKALDRVRSFGGYNADINVTQRPKHLLGFTLPADPAQFAHVLERLIDL
jgi:hypothetical protein